MTDDMNNVIFEIEFGSDVLTIYRYPIRPEDQPNGKMITVHAVGAIERRSARYNDTVLLKFNSKKLMEALTKLDLAFNDLTPGGQS